MQNLLLQSCPDYVKSEKDLEMLMPDETPLHVASRLERVACMLALTKFVENLEDQEMRQKIYNAKTGSGYTAWSFALKTKN